MSSATAEPGPIRWTGIGSWPGTDFDEALKITFDECPDFPYLPELPARGAHAAMIGRATAMLSELAVDLQPAGWRLTDASGADHRRARSTLRDDLDRLEEAAQGYAGLFKISVTGPWTLVASVERPRGDRTLADHGARRELMQSLTEGVAVLLAELQRRLPALQLVLQLDEPLLPAVMAGDVPTASGFSRHRSVDLPEISDVYSAVVDRLSRVGDGVPVTVHSCADGVPIGLLHRAGLRGLALDLDRLDSRGWDELGPAMEEGLWLGAGAVPTQDPGAPVPSGDLVAQRVLRPIRTVALEPEVASQTVLTPACGLAGFTPSAAVQVLRSLRTAAGIVTEELPR